MLTSLTPHMSLKQLTLVVILTTSTKKKKKTQKLRSIQINDGMAESSKLQNTY